MSTPVFLFHLLELVAALAASYYWLKTKDKTIKPFVWYLWLVVFVETIAMYPYLYDLVDNSFVESVANSKFRRNSWLYNLYGPFAMILFAKFIIDNTRTKLSHKMTKLFLVSYVIFCLCYFLTGDNFFKDEIPYDLLGFTLAMFFMVVLYLKELAKSDIILVFYKTPVFFVSMATLIFYIFITPLFIFNGFYLETNVEFMEFRRNFLYTSNIILYSWYTLAFLYPLRYKKKSAQK